MERRLYFLIATTAHRLRLEADRRCQAVGGTTAAQAGVLFVIEAEGPVTQRQIARELGLAESAVAGMVGRLVGAELVSRRRSAQDARAWELSLTREGARRLGRIHRELHEFNRAMNDRAAPDELDAAVRVLTMLRDRFPCPEPGTRS